VTAFEVTCGWCGKSQSKVEKMIVGTGVSWLNPPKPETSICNECVELCAEVIAIKDPSCRERLIARLIELRDQEAP